MPVRDRVVEALTMTWSAQPLQSPVGRAQLRAVDAALACAVQAWPDVMTRARHLHGTCAPWPLLADVCPVCLRAALRSGCGPLMPEVAGVADLSRLLIEAFALHVRGGGVGECPSDAALRAALLTRS